MRVLQERLIPGHWANADQLQRWLIEDEIAKLIHAGYLEKFGEDGVCLMEKRQDAQSAGVGYFGATCLRAG
jgi:hypothetical protein